MAQTDKKLQSNTVSTILKFTVPLDLKHTLQSLADERYLTLSAMMRVIASEYIKRHQTGHFTIADEKKQ